MYCTCLLDENNKMTLICMFKRKKKKDVPHTHCYGSVHNYSIIWHLQQAGTTCLKQAPLLEAGCDTQTTITWKAKTLNCHWDITSPKSHKSASTPTQLPLLCVVGGHAPPLACSSLNVCPLSLSHLLPLDAHGYSVITTIP